MLIIKRFFFFLYFFRYQTKNSSARYDDDWRDAKKKLLLHYKFELIVQNALCPHYIDEKLIYALEQGAIPIYLGATNLDLYEPSSDPKNHPAIIHIDRFPDVDSLWKHVAEVKENKELQQKYWAWREEALGTWPRFAASDNYTDSVECRMGKWARRRSHDHVHRCHSTWHDVIKGFSE